VDILVDGEVAGTMLAAVHRPDLAAAGIGDGNYGFSFALPFEIISRAREAMVSVRERDFGQVLGVPRLFRRRVVADAMEKITALEDDIRFLRASIGHAKDRKTAGEREAAELFRAVGDFFVELAETAEAGRPVGTIRTLRGAIADVMSQFAPLEFDYPAQPQISFCVEARGAASVIYATLRALHGMGFGQPSEVVLFDTGACDDAPLLPLVARNIRYIRTSGDSVAAACNEAACFARGRILVFIAANAEPVTYWLDSVLKAFEANETLAVLGAKIQLANGVLVHAGSLKADGRKVVLGFGEDPADDAFSQPRPIDGVAREAFAVRAGNWREAGGLNESFDDLTAALDDFCGQVAANGGGILYHPDFSFVLNDGDFAEMPDRPD